jgi:8-oxo-dGTP pyrophosphatase MutT (NUDIX family)
VGPRPAGRAGPTGPRVPQLTEVRAAGGVLWRRAGDGSIEVAVVHRPSHRDWSFPKGKLDPGETDEACALREVLEETGLAGELGDPLPDTTYVDRHGRHKRVRWWAMTVAGGEFAPNDEVDEVRWLGIEAARALLSYRRDRPLLDALVAKVGPGFTSRSP